MSEVNSFGELENLLQPFFYSSINPLPEVPKGSTPVPMSNTVKGFISEDCYLGCFYNREVIQCFAVDTKLSENHYTPKSHVPICIPDSPYTFPPRCHITCAAEFTYNQRASRGIRKILLGFDCTGVASHYNLSGGNGALAIYDPIQKKVLKWISVPSPVSTLRIVNHFERGDAIKPFYNGAMVAMVGIAAVGMLGGEVIIVDLGLDRTDAVQPTGIILFSSVTSHFQTKPYETIFVEPFDRLIATKRRHAINKYQLICVSVTANEELENETAISDNSSSSSIFIYYHQDGTEIARFNKNEVFVTAVEYVSNIGCLLIGYSFGGFQMWKVDDLSLQYSSTIPDSELAVLSFGFQQPIDDPKNFCYIWVLYGVENLQQSHSHLDLYQLFFLEKSHIENFGYIYQNLQKCAKNLSITLEDVHLPKRDPGDSEDGDSIDGDEADRYLVHPMRLWILDELVFISWNVARHGVFYVGIFDLNQWYSSHTAARIPTLGLCSFWVTIPVQRSGTYGIPWDFRLIPSSLVRWENSYKTQSIHLFPASITFQGASLTSDGIFCFEHFGLQEKLIRYILRDGHTEMAEPAQLRHLCQTYGLQPVTSRIYEPENLSAEDIDRFYIFTALLESKRPALIVKMANIWLDGSFANVGCTIDLIINWVRNLALSVRYLAEEHWYNTFNPQADTLLPETKTFIGYSNFIWNSLYSLLKTLIRHDEVYNVSRIPALDDLKNSLEKLVQYSATILMFCQAGILPSKDNVIESLLESKEQRRGVVKEAIMNCDIIPDEMKRDHPCLVIDQMMSNFGEDFVRSEWNLEPTECIYPPRDAAYVVNMIMWRTMDVKLISRVMFYFIIDFMTATGCLGTQSLCSKLKGDFQSVIHLTPDEQAELFRLWEVDHGYIDDPLSYLCQSQKFYDRDLNGAAWSTAATILTALKSDDLNTADLYRSGCPPLLGKLYVNIMSASIDKFKWLTNEICSDYSVVLSEPDMLQYFLKVASQKGLLEDFIVNKAKRAPPNVVRELIGFLEKTSNFDNQHLLVTFYLKTDNYEKAHQVHKNMKTFWGDGLLLDARQKVIWSNQLELMKKLPTTKPESKIHSFLNMKKPSDKVFKPTSQQTITIKPHRIMELSEPMLNFGEFSKPNNLMSQYQMSPLRKYIPRTVLDSKYTTNEQNSSSMLEENSSMNDSTSNNEDGATAINPSTPNKSRTSIGFDVESVLKTPTIDHRKKNRVTMHIQKPSASDESMNDSNYELPEEITTSILKKSEGSIRSKPISKTRFLDPSTGEEFASPPDTPDSMPQAPSFNNEAIINNISGESNTTEDEDNNNTRDSIEISDRSISIGEVEQNVPTFGDISLPMSSSSSQQQEQGSSRITKLSDLDQGREEEEQMETPPSNKSISDFDKNLQLHTPEEEEQQQNEEEIEEMDITPDNDELYVSVEDSTGSGNEFVDADVAVIGNDVFLSEHQLNTSASNDSFIIANDNLETDIPPTIEIQPQISLPSSEQKQQQQPLELNIEKESTSSTLEIVKGQVEDIYSNIEYLSPRPNIENIEKINERKENREQDMNTEENEEQVEEEEENVTSNMNNARLSEDISVTSTNRDSLGTDNNSNVIDGGGFDEAFVNTTGEDSNLESDLSTSRQQKEQQQVQETTTDENTGGLIFEKSILIVNESVKPIKIEREEESEIQRIEKPHVKKSKITIREEKITITSTSTTTTTANPVPTIDNNNDDMTEELFSSPSRIQQQIKEEFAVVKQEVISPIQIVQEQYGEDREEGFESASNSESMIKSEEMSISLFNSTEVEAPPRRSIRLRPKSSRYSQQNQQQLDESLTGEIIVNKQTMMEMSLSMIEDDRNLSSDQDSPNKSEKGNTEEDEVFKSPVKKRGRPPSVKSESAASSSAEDNAGSSNVVKSSTRTRRNSVARKVRSSVTPESDAGSTGSKPSGRRLTRSDARKLLTDGNESDQSFSGDDHNLSLNTSQGSVPASKKSRTPRKMSLQSVPENEEQNVSDDVKPLITRQSLRSRSKSESPSRVLAPAGESSKRKRRTPEKKEAVWGYAPELSTVLEQSDMNSGSSKSQLDNSVLNASMQSDASIVVEGRVRPKRRKTSSTLDPLENREDHDDSMSDISTTSTTSRRSSRRSMTPVNKAAASTTTDKPSSRRRKRSEPK